MEHRLDGNAVAGLLREIFALEMTVAEGTCASCGAVAPIGGVHVYVNAPGVVVRCPACGQVLLTVVKGGRRIWLDVTGVRRLQMTVEEET